MDKFNCIRYSIVYEHIISIAFAVNEVLGNWGIKGLQVLLGRMTERKDSMLVVNAEGWRIRESHCAYYSAARLSTNYTIVGSHMMFGAGDISTTSTLL